MVSLIVEERARDGWRGGREEWREGGREIETKGDKDTKGVRERGRKKGMVRESNL